MVPGLKLSVLVHWYGISRYMNRGGGVHVHISAQTYLKKSNMTNNRPDQLQQKSNQCHNQQRKAPVLKCKYMASTLKQLKK